MRRISPQVMFAAVFCAFMMAIAGYRAFEVIVVFLLILLVGKE